MKKDLDKLLLKNAPVPKRELKADFTATTLAKLAERKPTALGRLKETFTMRFATFAKAHKPATIAAAVIGLIVISGTATATTVGWPHVLAMFAGQKELPGGSRIVQVDTKNCQFVTALNVTKPKTKDATYYYRVHADSKLSNDDITHIVQGYCDEEAESAANTAAFERITGKKFDDPTNHSDLRGGYIDNVITAISPTTLTVTFTMPVGTAQGMTSKTATLTFNHIANDVIVIGKGEQLSYKDLRVGDHIAYSYHDGGGVSGDPAPWEVDTSKATVAMIFKNTADMTWSLKYQYSNNKDFEEVVPCKTQPDGYCTAWQLN